ncbi:Effector protein Avr3a [Phytophthora nicotianae]|uniref:Effector protein Avr3a n=1 Tax=Phytophthora nicotianae TaxID=4792 RepID=A0A0W8DVA4_PHYNI|nr:Effector protein Avr3a [Phytophthora nicotianae]
MRLTIILSVTVVAICLAACSAIEDFDQTKDVMNDSPKKDAKKLAKALMADHKLAKAAYISWEHHPFTLKQLDDFLKLASRKTNGEKYNQLYNGYMMHLGITGV